MARVTSWFPFGPVLVTFGPIVKLRNVRTGRELPEKNGYDPWLFNLREPWLRLLVLDFEGTRRVCEALTSNTLLADQARAQAPAGFHH